MANFRRLKKMKLDEVSLVVAGDDPEAVVVLAKAAPEDELSDKTQTSSEDVSTLTSGTATEENIVADEHDENIEIDTSGLDPEILGYIEQLEDTVEAYASADEVTDAVEEILDTEAVLAKADPVVRDLIAKAQAEASEAREVAKAERDLRVRREFVSKAQTMPMISTDAEHLGEILKAVSEGLAPEVADEVTQLLAAANEQIAASNIFKEIGSGAPGVSNTLEAAAAEIRKSGPDLTAEQAIAEALNRNPALYTQES